MSKKKIIVDGKSCEVVEDLGTQDGMKAKFVMDRDRERVAVFDRGKWRFWTVSDRIR